LIEAGEMDDIYQINVAKTEFQEAYNRGDVEQLISVFGEDNFTDMSQGAPIRDGQAARERLREHAARLFAEYSVRLEVIIFGVTVFGDTACDYGCHEFTLTRKKGGETVRTRERYVELWKRTPSGDWKIALFINNPDIRDELGGQVSRWFLSQEGSGNPRSSRE